MNLRLPYHCYFLLGCCLLLLVTACSKPEEDFDARKEFMRWPAPPLTKEGLQARVEAAKKAHLDAAALKAGGWVLVMDAPEVLESVRLLYPGDVFFDSNSPVRRGRMLAKIKHFLGYQQPEIASEALEQLMELRPAIRMDGGPDLCKLVYRHLHHPKTRFAATGLIVEMDCPHAQDSLMQMIYSGELEAIAHSDVLRELGNTIPNDTTIRFLAMLLHGYGDHPAARGDTIEEVQYALLKLHEQATDAQRQEIEDLTMPYIKHPHAESRVVSHAMFVFSLHPRESMLSLFQANLEGPLSTRDALRGIAAIQGAAARNLVLDYLGSEETAYDALKAVPFAFAGAVDSVFQPLRILYGLQKDESLYKNEILDLVWQMGGLPSAYAFANSFKQTSDREQLTTYYHDFYDSLQLGHPFWTEAQLMIDLGLLEGPIPQKRLQEIQVAHRPRIDHRIAHIVLQDEERLALVDQDQDRILHDYPSLVAFDFVSASHGLLDSLDCYFSVGKAANGDRVDQIWLLFRGKGYYFETQPVNGGLNVQAVVNALNFVLADIGAVERYCKIPKPIERWEPFYLTGDPNRVYDAYLFVDPKIAPQAMQVLGFGG